MLKKLFSTIYFLLLFTSLITSNILIAQSVDELDKKYGFQKFKLGSDVSVIKDKVQIVPYHDKNPKVKGFNYSGNDIKQVFAVPISEIRLTFYEDKLMSIHVSLQTMFTNQV